MITMAMIGKVLRMRHRDNKSVREIARATSLSRNTVRKYLRRGKAEAQAQARAAEERAQAEGRTALADAEALADAVAEALNAAATFALILPSRAASCAIAIFFSRSTPSRLLHIASEVVCPINNPSPGIGMVGG